MNVIVAIDTSATAYAALAATLSRSWPADTSFRILTVAPQGHVEKARRLVDRASDSLKAEHPDANVETQIDSGDPATTILKHVEAWPADLVIVGSHDRGPFERFFMGSVSRKIIEAAQCSVLIARNFDVFMNRVLIAFDNSVGAAAALDQVMRTRWAEGTQFHLLSVTDTPAVVTTFEPCAAFVNTDLDAHRQVVRQAEAALHDVAAQLEDQFGVGCGRLCETGDPRHCARLGSRLDHHRI
jgi:nucleotide-binding universal stress UspA family protein